MILDDMPEWYTIKNAEAIDTPALVVYQQRVEQNIASAVAMIGDVTRLRPHVKTNKSLEVTRLMLQAGITKFKCATIAEAEMLAMAGATDVLLAYQLVGPKVHRFFLLVRQYPDTTFSCLVDDIAVAENIAAISLQQNTSTPVFIDVDAGMHRTGVALKSVSPLYAACSALAGLQVKGLHVYDGHIRNSSIETRTEMCNHVFEKIIELVNAIKATGLQKPLVIAGGSPTFPIHAKRTGIECSPGTFIYWDKGYQTLCAEQPFVPAALVLARIVSIPNEQTLCIDLGHKSIASESDLQKRVGFLNAPDLQFTGHSEEHLMATTMTPHNHKVGDILFGLPYHICPTIALYERAIVIKDGAVTGEWKNIARDRKITI